MFCVELPLAETEEERLAEPFASPGTHAKEHLDVVN
jgi:hypothetical protein